MPDSSEFVLDSSTGEIVAASSEVSFDSFSFDIGSVALSNVLLIGLFVIVIFILVRSHK